MKNLTENQISRIKQAIKETENLLAKELKYSADLQHANMVEFYKNHINTLKARINE